MLVIFLGLVGLWRLTILPGGYFYIQDELRYRYSLALVRELASGNLIEAIKQLFQFNLYARPGMVLVHLPTAIMQAVIFLILGIKTETPNSFFWVKVVHWGISLILLSQIFQLYNRYLKPFLAAFTGLVIYALLINSNFYLRHILPYDFVLLVFFLALNWYLKNYLVIFSERLSWLMGIIGGIIFSVYPPYFLLSIILGTMTSFLPLKKWFVRGLMFASGVAIVITGWEILSRLLGESYWQDLIYTSSRAILGDPNETFVFLYKYLWIVEGAIGKVIVMLFSLFVVLKVIKNKLEPELDLLIGSAFATYGLYAINGPLGGKVYYGRIIHIFFPFIILGAIKALTMIVKGKKIFLALLGLTTFSLISTLIWYPKFIKIRYPRDILFHYCQNNCSQITKFIKENQPLVSQEIISPDNPKLLAVNFLVPYPLEDIKYPIVPPDGAKLLLGASHPLNFTAYQFEWLSSRDRNIINQHHFELKLYSL